MIFGDIKVAIRNQFPVLDFEIGEDPFPFVVFQSQDWLKIARFLRRKKGLKFDSLHCITGIDNGPENKLEVRYSLYSMSQNHWLEVRIELDREDPHIPSVERIWRTADWLERETYDMYGIIFDDHRDLRRILLDDDWEGWPLRKDYVTPEFYRDMPVPKEKD